MKSKRKYLVSTGDESWHEVLRLISGLLEPKFAGEIIDYLMEQNDDPEEFGDLFLATKCLSEIENRFQIKETDNRLLKLMKELIQHKGYSGRVFQFTSQAVEAIATTWKDDPNTLPWLKSLAQSDENGFVQCAAVRALARGWKNDPDTLPILKTCAQSDENQNVRRTAVEELARGWKDDLNTLPWLKTHTESNDNGVARYTAVEELTSGWKDNPDNLSILKTRVQFDNYPPVRCLAVRKLASRWKDESGMFEFLCDRALNDPFERKEDWENNPRQTALEAIIEQYPDHPQILLLLRDRAENDPEEKVREFAKEKLEQLERQN